MTQSWILVGIFVAILVCLPAILKWIKHRYPGRHAAVSGQSRFISALAVGTHQRVVTVEVGPEGRRVWLTLGVTSQNISCLHCVDLDASQNHIEQSPIVGLGGSNANGTEAH